jgi:phenylpyruvate tautomerase PptA (4-oxalocrotonate tautomerase family)
MSNESSVVKVQLDESALAHYASQYYDPVKAKEYYERTKKLKGRDEGELSDTQKEAFGYAKTQITEEKQRVLKDTAGKQREAIENIRKGAEAMREAIAARLTELMAKVEAAESEQRDQIAAETRREASSNR